MNVDEVPVIDFQLEVEKIASSFSGSQFENDLIDHGGAPCVPLITKLCEFILNKNHQDAVIIAKELSEVSWQQLHTGHWKDVALAWRQLYSLACLLSVLIDRLHSPNKVTHSDKIDQIKLLDKALLMGGPHYADLIHKLVDVIHAELIVELEQNNNNNDSVKEKKDDNSEDKAVEHERQVGQKYKSDQLDEAEEPPKKRLRLLHAMALQSRIKPAPVIDAEHQIKRIKPPSLLTFKQQYMDLNEPVVIEDLIHHWRAVWRWKDVSYLRSISGYRTVPVEIGQHYIHTDWSQQLMTLNEFIDIYITAEKPPSNHEDAGKIGYVAQTELFEQIPKLKADFTIPEYTSMSEKDTLIVHAWYGPGGTISPLHQDPYHNLLAQPVGSKYIRLYAPNEPVYPHEGDKILFNTSQVDVEKPDYGNFPKFKEATYSETILRAGDVLYIPPKYWHYLRSLETSFSFEYSLDDKTFDKHLLAICDSAKCIGLSTNYVLSADGTNTIVQPMDLKKKPPKANDIFNLILSPKKCREIPSLREVIQSMADLDSGNMNRIKKAAFELMEKLKDSAWSETFRIQNGVPLLVKVIEKATGNLLAYSLRALESYIRAVFNLSFIRTTLMNKLLDSIFMSELNVVRPALNILALMTDPLTVDQAKGALLFIRRKQIDWSHIVQLLVNSDIGIQMATLTFINHMLNALSFEKDEGAAGINNTINGNNNSATPNIVVINEPSNNAKSQPTELEDFMDMLCDSIGILYILEKQTQIESLELRRQISIFQSYYLRRLTKNRGVPFDESRDEHMKLLTRLWNACFAGEQFQGVVSERWKEIGFQYKNPLTDLRSVGVMGLEHLLFYAETYSQNFLDKARVQQLKPFEFQYPLCVAGLHISQLLTVDVFQLTENDRKGPPNPDVRLVHPMLLQQEGLLNMYSIIFERLDLDWEIKRARYLEFAQIFEPIKLDVARILTEHGLLDLTKFKFLLLGAEHKDVIHPVIAANNLKHAPIGARLSMQVHPTSYYLELARKSDLFSEAIDIDLSPVSTPRRPSVSRDHATLESEDPFLKHRLKESGKRVTSMHVVSANDSRVVTPQVASSSPPLTPATESPRDKFLLSGANRILSRSARNSAVPGASRSNDEFKELDYSMMETIKYTGPSTSEEWPQAMPIYLKKKVLAHNNTASDVNRSAADDAITTRKLSKVTRVKSAPDMSASIRKASIPREDPPKQQQTEPKTTPVEQGAQGSPNRHLITNGANKDKSPTPTPTQSPQVSKIVTAAHVTAPPIPMKQSSKSQKTIARPPPPTSPRPLSLASKTNAVNPTSVAEASTVPEPHSDPAPSVQTQGSPPHDLRTPQPVTSTAHRPAVKTPHVIAEPVNVPQATDSLPPVKLGHTLVSRNSLPKKPAPPGSNTLRHVTSADNLAATVPKTSPVKTAPPKVPLSPKPALSSQPQQQGPLPKTAPAPAKKKFGPAPVKQLH